MDLACSIKSAHERIKSVATTGFAVGFYVKYASPNFLWQDYPEAWTRIYSAEGLHLKDPTILWALQNRGVTRWSDIKQADPAGVMQRAAQHGLAFGAAICMDTEAGPILGGFARHDRELHEGELRQLHEELVNLDALIRGSEGVSPEARSAMQSAVTS